jgi:hypothetical protein
MKHPGTVGSDIFFLVAVVAVDYDDDTAAVLAISDINAFEISLKVSRFAAICHGHLHGRSFDGRRCIVLRRRIDCLWFRCRLVLQHRAVLLW